MNLATLTEKLNNLVPEELRYNTPVAIEKQLNLDYIGTISNHFAISGMDSETDPGNIELLAPFENAPHTNVGILMNGLNNLAGQTSNISARVTPQGEKLEIIDVISYQNLYVILRGKQLANK